MLAQGQELLAADAHFLPEAAKILVHEVVGKGIVAGGHGGVGGKDRGATDLLGGLVQAVAGLGQLAQALQHQKGRVPLVQVPGAGLDAQGAQDAHAAQAQHDLLADARFLVAAVEPRREVPIPGGVLLTLVSIRYSWTRPARTCQTWTCTGVPRRCDLDQQTVAVGVQDGVDRHLVEIEGVIVRLAASRRAGSAGESSPADR